MVQFILFRSLSKQQNENFVPLRHKITGHRNENSIPFCFAPFHSIPLYSAQFKVSKHTCPKRLEMGLPLNSLEMVTLLQNSDPTKLSLLQRKRLCPFHFHLHPISFFLLQHHSKFSPSLFLSVLVTLNVFGIEV